MYANRFTALFDACTLVPPLQRNVLLTLAEADFYRPRWSRRILEECRRGIVRDLSRRPGLSPSPDERAAKSIDQMVRAFADASVEGHERFETLFAALPDDDDRHVAAAAIATSAQVLVTSNLKDFPVVAFEGLSIEILEPADFVVQTIDLHPHRALLAMETMRQRFRQPAVTFDALLTKLEVGGMARAAEALARAARG